MKKIRILLLCLAATAVAMGFMGCDGLKANGTVKVRIVNNADVPLTVTGIKESRNSSYMGGDSGILGTYGTEAAIPVGGDREFEIVCKSDAIGTASVNSTKIECFCTSGSSVVYPYTGTISGTSVTRHSDRTNTSYFDHTRFELSSSNPGTITFIYKFVKTTSGDYVLAQVQ